MANKGGTLANIGQALSGYGSALTGNPMYLQNSMLMRQAMDQRRQQEEHQRQNQVGNASALNFLRSVGMEGTPATKQYTVPAAPGVYPDFVGRTVGQNREAVAPNADPLRMLAAFSNGDSPLQSLAAKQAIEMMGLNNQRPTYQTVKPGETLGSVGSDGKFNTIYTAPNQKDEKPFDPTNMQIPGTDRVALARTPEEFNALAKRGFVKSGTNVPGAKTDSLKDKFGDESKLRGEFDAKTKDFVTTRDAYSRVVQVAQSPSAAGDIALIFGYMKMNDPNSTVREGEYATAQNAGSIPQRVWAAYNKALSGETLTPAQRADFVAQAGRLYSSQVNSFTQDYKRYSDLAGKYGMDASKVVYDRTNGLPSAMPAQEASGTAQAATLQARPRAVNPVTGQAVEWDGTSWVEAK